jgi:single-strand DNA-binding protein
MEITGRLTADATVSTAKNDRQVVSFTVAINDSYKKNGEIKKRTTFYNCAYWLNTDVARSLTKGTIVSLYGSLSTSAYIDVQGEAQTVLHFHTNVIKIVSKAKKADVAA